MTRTSYATRATAATSPGPLLSSVRDSRYVGHRVFLPGRAKRLRQAMAEATETLDLTGVLGVLQRWQRVAWSARDRHAHREMLEHADQLNSGGEVVTESWQETKARLGL